MPGRILKRCDVCGHWGAAYLVPDSPAGAKRYCSRCWKAAFGTDPARAQTSTSGAEPAADDAPSEPAPPDTHPHDPG